MVTDKRELMKLIRKAYPYESEELVEDAVFEMRDLLHNPHTPPAVKAKLIMFILEMRVAEDMEEWKSMKETEENDDGTQA